MGDMADLALEYALDDCEEFERYRNGEFSPQEAYDRGFVNALGGEYPNQGYSTIFRRSSVNTTIKPLVCKNCKAENLYWAQHESGKWWMKAQSTKQWHKCLKFEEESDE